MKSWVLRGDMKGGLWYWPESQKEQEKTINGIARLKFLRTALESLAKSPSGLSNAELDEAIGANSNWMTLWVARQLMAMGLVKYKVDLFGGPGRYQITERGKEVVQKLATLSAQIASQG